MPAVMPDRAKAVVHDVMKRHRVKPEDLFSPSRVRKLVIARQEIFYTLKSLGEIYSAPRIGRMFSRDSTTVLYGIAAHQKRTGAPRLTNFGGVDD